MTDQILTQSVRDAASAVSAASTTRLSAEQVHKLVSIRTIAAFLDLSPAHVRDRLVKREGFPRPYMIGGVRRWDFAEVVEWTLNRQS